MKAEPRPNTVNTADNSLTFFSEEYGETYHSASGAISEAINKFVKPCGIETLAKKGEVRILDIGFGLGYNIVSALHAARNSNKECEIEIVSLEKAVLCQPELNMLELPPQLAQHYDLVKILAEKHCVTKNGIRLTLLEGDGRKKIRETDGPFDAVFLDPFSPRKNPELWSVDFFMQIASLMTETAILATYSSATPVRCGLIEAGLKIGPGPGDSMKRGGTLATKKSNISPLSEKESIRLKISPERMPYRDPNLVFSREDIFKYRNHSMKE